jgi:RHS repeat-associated protein
VAWTSTGDQDPTETTIYDPDGNRLGTPPALSDDPSRPNLLFEGADTAPLKVPVAQMGARSYVPALGIFLQPDPIPNGSSTPYNYAVGDPINASDTSGMSTSFGQWWKENRGVVIGVTVSVVLGVALGAATGGTGAAVGWKTGAIIGAMSGGWGEAITQSVDIHDGKRQGLDGGRILISAVIGAVLGGVSVTKSSASAAQRRAAAARSEQLTAAARQRLSKITDDAAKMIADYQKLLPGSIANSSQFTPQQLMARFNAAYGSGGGETFTLVSRQQLRALKASNLQASVGSRSSSGYRLLDADDLVTERPNIRKVLGIK